MLVSYIQRCDDVMVSKVRDVLLTSIYYLFLSTFNSLIYSVIEVSLAYGGKLLIWLYGSSAT